MDIQKLLKRRRFYFLCSVGCLNKLEYCEYSSHWTYTYFSPAKNAWLFWGRFSKDEEIVTILKDSKLVLQEVE